MQSSEAEPDYTIPDEGEPAAQQEYVIQALEEANRLVAAIDQITASIYLLRNPPNWLPLRTKLDQASKKAKAVLQHLDARRRPAPVEMPRARASSEPSERGDGPLADAP